MRCSLRLSAVMLASVALAACAISCHGCAGGGASTRPSQPAASPPAAAQVYDNLVTVRDAAAEMAANPDVFILDVRSRQEYDAGHLKGSVVIPDYRLAANLTENAVYPEINHGRVPRQDQRIICVCSTGHRSADIAQDLRRRGYDKASSVAGGLNAWLAAGMPLEKGPMTQGPMTN